MGDQERYETLDARESDEDCLIEQLDDGIVPLPKVVKYRFPSGQLSREGANVASPRGRQPAGTARA